MARESGDKVPGFGCYWRTVRVLDLPSEVAFQDYSAIALHRSSATVAITSQENSQVGKLPEIPGRKTLR